MAMKLSLKEISRVGEREYQVSFATEVGSDIVVHCAVENDEGISFIIPKPDLFMDGSADARSVTAAVLAFHRAATWGPCEHSNMRGT
jgi:hypothetical protein